MPNLLWLSRVRRCGRNFRAVGQHVNGPFFGASRCKDEQCRRSDYGGFHLFVLSIVRCEEVVHEQPRAHYTRSVRKSCHRDSDRLGVRRTVLQLQCQNRENISVQIPGDDNQVTIRKIPESPPRRDALPPCDSEQMVKIVDRAGIAVYRITRVVAGDV